MPVNITVATGLLSSISEWADQLIETICKGLYEALKSSVVEQFSGMMEVMNNQILKSKDLVTESPQSWNASAFSFIQGIAENAIIPIAACILVFVFCWELIHLVQDNNQMHNIKPDTMIIMMIKLGICLLVCSRSFDIVMGLFDIASFAADKVAASATGDIPSNIESLFQDPDVYDFKCVFAMLGNYLITMLCKWFTYVIAIMIFLRVNLWYLELLIYASMSSVPFSTFMNKEWGQMGQNYLRKMLAVCFEGTLMLIAFGLYKYLVANITNGSYLSSGDFIMSMFMSLGCGIVLLILLTKVGNISSSIFNAH